MIFRLGELFCGPGGLACGAMNAQIENPNFRIVHQWANDYDEDTGTIFVRITQKLFIMLISASSI